MTDRNELAKLYVKRKEYIIGKNLPENERAKLVVIPLSIDEMSLFENKEDATMEDKKNQSIKLISKSIDAKEEDVKLISIGFLEEIMDAIMDANNFGDSPKIKAKLEEMRKNVTGTTKSPE